MVKTSSLIKIFIKERFFNKKKTKTTNKDNKKSIIGLILILGLVLFYSYMFVETFKMMFDTQKLFIDNYNKVLYTIVGLTNISALVFILISGNSFMFTKADESVLGPLPIEERKIVFAKLFIALITDTFFDILIGISATIAYFLSGDVTVVGVFVVLFSPILAGVLPICLLSFIIIWLKRLVAKSKIRRPLELIGLLFTLLFIMAFSAVFSVNSSAVDPESVQILGGVYAAVLTYYPLLILIKLALDLNNIIYFIYYVLALALISFIFIKLFTKYAYRLMIEPTNTYYGKKTKIEYKKNDFNKILLKKEFKRAGSSNILLLNAGVMPILLSIMFLVIGVVSKNNVFNVSMIIPGLDINIKIIDILASYFVISSVPSLMFPSFSLSLESKNMWIIVSLPIDSKKVLWIKRLFNYICQGVTLLTLIIIYLIIGDIDILLVLGLLILGVGVSVFSTNLYQIVNLKYPCIGMDDATLVKQSKPAFISSMVMIGFIFFVPVVVVLSFLLFKDLRISIMILGVVSFIIGYLINKKINKVGPILLKNFC